MVRRVSSEHMVGRSEAAEAVSRSLEVLRAGASVHLVISGEAGVGKTRLLEHARAQAERAGITVVAGACFDLGDQSLPWAPFTGILRSLIDVHGPATIRALAGREAATLEWLAPTLADADVEASAKSSRLAPERLYESLLSLLRRVSERAPILIQLEDLHDADEGTLDAARYLMRSLRDDPVALYATYRSEELAGRDLVRSWLGEVARGAQVERLALTPLSEPEMRELVEAIAGAPVAPRLLATIMARSDGNPFFAEELLASSVEGPLSASLQDVLIARADHVAPDARRLLDVAAVGGREVGHDLLVAIADVGERTATHQLAGLVDAGLLVPLSTSDGEAYRFRHALLAEVVRSRLLPVERRRWHAAYARELAQRDTHTADAAEAVIYAYHLREAGDPRALQAALTAGDAAADVMAWDVARAEREHALRLLDAAVDRGEGPGLGRLHDRSDLLEAIADAAFSGGRFSQAIALLQEVLEGVDHSDRARLVRLWVALGESYWRTGERDRGVEGMRNAVRLAGDEADEVRVRALAGLGQVEMLVGDMPAAREHAEAAAQLARMLGLRRLEGHASCTLAIVLGSLGDANAALDAGRLALELALELSEPHDVGRAFVNLADTHWQRGDAEAALALVEEGLARADDQALTADYRSDLAYGGVLFAYDTGDWASARRLLDVGDDDSLGTPASEAYRAEYALRFLVGSGAPDAERTWLRARRMASEQITADSQTLVVAGGMELLTRAGHYAEAVAVTEERLESAEHLESWVVFHELLCLLAWPLAEIVRAAHATGEKAVVREATGKLERLRASAARVVEAMGHPAGQLGAWLRVQGQQAAAEAHRASGTADPVAWDAAAQAWTELGRPYRVAYCRWRQAQALVEADDLPAAGPVLREAWSTAVRLGATPLRADLERTARAAGLPRFTEGQDRSDDPVDRRPFGLTSRESEVLSLVAAGYTNRRIAEQLYISRSTVGVHVSNILAKLDVSSRVDATRIAVSEGLLAGPPPT